MIEPSVPELPATEPLGVPGRRVARARAEGRVSRRRMLTWALFLGCAVLMVNAVIGENGYLATVRARHRNEAVQADIARIQGENQRLLDQTRRLKTDAAALEEEARRDLGLIRPGETLIILRDAKPAAPASSAPSGQGK